MLRETLAAFIILLNVGSVDVYPESFELHRSLGVIVLYTNETHSVYVAFPVYYISSVRECNEVFRKEHLQYYICSDSIEYTLGQPSLFSEDGYEWQSIDIFKEKYNVKSKARDN
jgi:hypothetical protein